MKKVSEILPQVIKRLERSASEAAAKKHLALIAELLKDDGKTLQRFN